MIIPRKQMQKIVEELEGTIQKNINIMDETYVQEYKQILVDVIDHPNLPIVCNINIGHAQPRCILPFGVVATVDIDNQVIRFAN